MKKIYLIVLPLIVVLLGGFYFINSKNDASPDDSTPSEPNQPAGQKNMIQHGFDFSNQAAEVIDYEGNYLLVSKLRVGEAHPPHATGPGCGDKHWHADEPLTAVNNGVVVSDPLAGGCGFGTLAERPVLTYFPHELLAD